MSNENLIRRVEQLEERLRYLESVYGQVDVRQTAKEAVRRFKQGDKDAFKRRSA